jgi:hypothetical protein
MLIPTCRAIPAAEAPSSRITALALFFHNRVDDLLIRHCFLYMATKSRKLLITGIGHLSEIGGINLGMSAK